ncbi:MAG: 4-(cytidine 5'-diphospho)-2-C-methyl-D-erythritol kinase [Actinomycetota bacterium]
MLKFIARAKINLYLDVADKRPDGFHEVKTVLQSVTLADEIMFTPNESGIEVAYGDFGKCDFHNDLIIQAWEALAALTGHDACFTADVKKVIPAAAGLGGGSADAAAALIGLNKLYGLGLDQADLRRIAEDIGADVPFFLTGGTMEGTGAGETLKPLPAMPDCEIVILKPSVDVSTGRAYQDFDEAGTAADEHKPGLDALESALSNGDYGQICESLFNAFEPVIMGKYPAIRAAKEAALAAGADAALMSGSGSTVFALTRSSGIVEDIISAGEETGAQAYRAKPCNVAVVEVD